MLRHGGEILVDTLIAHGVTRVFGIPGGQATPFYEALAHRKEKISHIVVRDERSAVFAADAYARVSGRIGVCDATVGPGAMNFPAGMMEAYNSSVPILAILSDHPRDAVLLQERGRISQGGDQAGMLKPFVKEAVVVPGVEMLSKVIAAAIHTAVSGRPGPVLVVIPQDVFKGESNVGVKAGSSEFPKFRCVPPAEQIDEAVKLLVGAQRPLLLAGGGVQLSGAAHELTALADTCRLPVVTTISGKGSIPEDSELSLGVLGDFGNPAAKAVADAADVILAIGYKHSQNSSYRWTWPTLQQKLIHVDIDPVELGRIFHPEVALWGDARETITIMLSAMSQAGYQGSEEWQSYCQEKKTHWAERRLQEQTQEKRPLWPQAVIREIQKQMNQEDYVVFDASFSSGWGAAYLDVMGFGRRALFPRGAAGLGFSLPAAIGVSQASPGSRVICVAGDGAFSYSLGELATAKRLGLPITCVVLNNGTYSWVKWTQTLNLSGAQQSVDIGTLDYAAIAQGFGIKGMNAANLKEVGESMEQALSEDGPAVINVTTDEWQSPSVAYREAMKKAKQGEVMNQTY